MLQTLMKLPPHSPHVENCHRRLAMLFAYHKIILPNGDFLIFVWVSKLDWNKGDFKHVSHVNDVLTGEWNRENSLVENGFQHPTKNDDCVLITFSIYSTSLSFSSEFRQSNVNLMSIKIHCIGVFRFRFFFGVTFWIVFRCCCCYLWWLISKWSVILIPKNSVSRSAINQIHASAPHKCEPVLSVEFNE